jgi:hypothetical protein
VSDNVFDLIKLVIKIPHHSIVSGFVFKLGFDSFHKDSIKEMIVIANKILAISTKAGMMSALVKSSPIIREIKFFILIRFKWGILLPRWILK